MTESNTLLYKLDRFIRKYYRNRLIRGTIWSVTFLALLFLVFIFLENLFRFSSAGRMVLFFSFVAGFLFMVTRLVVIPALQLAKIGRIITREQAAHIIGQHFSEIGDKLVNTLQLMQDRHTGDGSDLLAASIEQKTSTLRVFRFSMAIDLRKNLRFLRYTLVPVAIILVLAAVSPGTISEPTKRIIQYNQAFIPPQPFTLGIRNKALTAIQQQDFELQVKAEGTEMPAEVTIKTREGNYRMTREKGFLFTHVFRSVQGNITFRLAAGEYLSGEYELKVFPKPTILNFDVTVKYPGYLGKPDEKIENQGDMVVPEGSVMTWKFFTKDVTSIKARFGSEQVTLAEKQGNAFTHSLRVMQAMTYSVAPYNANTYQSDSLRYRVNVVTDGFPSVFVTESTDSLVAANLFFRGTIKDDYGFSKLTFNYAVYERGDTVTPVYRQESIPIDPRVNNQVFYHQVDLLKLLPTAGLNISYYFEIWDNDGIRGPKPARSEVRTIATPTLEEIALRTDENEQMNNLDMEQSIEDAKAMRKTVEELNRKMVDQTAVSWQEKKKIEDLIKASEAIEKRVEQVKKRNEENMGAQEKYLETSERILDKQKRLNDMMDQMLPEDLKKMIEEMRQLLNQVDKEKLGNLLEKMKLSNKDLEEQLDRNLALMKQIEFDRKLEQTIEELRKTAEEQEKLAEKTENRSESNEKLASQQEEIKRKADSIEAKVRELEKEGADLENPAELGNTKEKTDSIGSSLGESSRKLKENRNKEAAGSQKKTAKQMRDLAAQMESSQGGNEEEQLEEDEANLRMILENLVRLSFDQEEMIGVTRQIARTDPRYTALVARQKEFGQKMKVVEDSLVALSRRQLAIQPVVTREIAAINLNIGLTLEAMDTRNINIATAKQQYTMTAINNLALLLNEALQKMNQDLSMCQGGSGSKSCSKPGGKGKGKMSAKNMKELQQSIGKQLEKLKSGMESAKQGKEGQKQGQSQMSRELARLAAQQEALRKAMQDYQDEMGLKGLKDQAGMSEAAKDMEQIEKDLVNKRITQETLRRQQNILTRLLESEKAEQMRDQDEKRESTEAKSVQNSNPGTNYQYNTKRRAGQDEIQLTLPGVNMFYRNKINNYIVKIGN